ncbi:Smr/MutS family protein [Thiomicrorhabdus aquaedulcis]|uniref:Smr/MutS family protein n=1 Tax=Thiomicrorhabdus aquaedulcis TaxID=2211106 RepID=UPI001561F7E8|nr:Smr/MutS family protein [Thiomicrorhabdus aquaedulcis]
MNAPNTQLTTQATLKKIKARNRQALLNPESIDNRHTKNSYLLNLPALTAADCMLFQQKGVRTQELNKLRKGDFNCQGSLDLHGCIVEESVEIIHDFIKQASQQQLRYVRLIHGKGYNSNDTFPALKNCVNRELRSLKNVLAFCSAPEKDGGVGAVNVFLKAPGK